MDLALNNEDLAQLITAALEGRAEVRGLTCDDDTITVRVAVGILPATLEFREFHLDGDAVSLRVAGAVAPRLLGLFRTRIEAANIQVEGDQLRVPFPALLTDALELTALEVTGQGVQLRGHCRGLPRSNEPT